MGKTPEEIKRGLEYIAETNVTRKVDLIRAGIAYQFTEDLAADVIAYIQQLEEDKKRLQERICNQRRSLRLLHAMYEWALGRLQKAKLNDRAHFQAWLRERGYDLTTMELPEAQVPKWFSVMDDLPTTEDDVLVLFGGIDVDVGWFNGYDGEWRTYGSVSGTVTHWMPLPEAPKEG